MDHNEITGMGALHRMMGALDPKTEKGAESCVMLADHFVEADRRRTAMVEGVRSLYMAEQDDKKKAVAALDFLLAQAQAERRFVESLRDAAAMLLEHVTDGRITPGMIRDVQARAEAVMGSPEFLAYAEEHREGEDCTLSIEARMDGCVRVTAVNPDTMEPLANPIFFAPDGSYLGTDDPPEMPEISGESTIEGIDLSQTFDPDADGSRNIRDFDGGTGDA